MRMVKNPYSCVCVTVLTGAHRLSRFGCSATDSVNQAWHNKSGHYTDYYNGLLLIINDKLMK